jgi:hypothetical protein
VSDAVASSDAVHFLYSAGDGSSPRIEATAASSAEASYRASITVFMQG